MLSLKKLTYINRQARYNQDSSRNPVKNPDDFFLAILDEFRSEDLLFLRLLFIIINVK